MAEIDWLMEENAMKLAAELRAFWRERGLDPDIRVERQGGLWVIRSDMVGGLPRKRFKVAA